MQKEGPKSIFYKGKIEKNNNLCPITSEMVVNRIRSDEALKHQVKLLRRVRQVDLQAYKRQKVKLPFFIGADFLNGIRRMENYLQINAFTVDIDNCFLDLPFDDDLLESLKLDPRIFIMFRSPSGKGLKLVFLISNGPESPKDYSDFYRTFIYRFCKKYKIESFVDSVTSDVTRVCFLSFDPGVYYNPRALPVEFHRHKPTTQQKVNQQEDLPNQESDKQGAQDKGSLEKEFSGSPNASQYKEILNKLGTKPKIPGSGNYRFKIPGQLEKLLPFLKSEIGKYQLVLKEERNIQYGKKVVVSQEEDWAEVNIFYGKKGFSVVLSPKTGSDPDLGALLERLIYNAIEVYYIERPNHQSVLESMSPENN